MSADAFPDAARRALTDVRVRANLLAATTTIREKRAAVVSELDDWEALRDAGAAAKAGALERLADLLPELEANVIRAGGLVHWARDAAEANAIVVDLVRSTGALSAVKVKSLATDEIHLNDALAAVGVEVVETDLAELVCQLAGERPSHLLVPAIHKSRAEIRDLLRVALDRPELSDDPDELTAAARDHLRAAFLRALVGISGGNVAVAETGTVGVVESEGNGRMCTTLPETLITVLGIEKVVARWTDLDSLLQLLPRSSTGERMNPYTSFWTGVHAGDGPTAFHLVLLDNGRTAALADPVGRDALRCIRCSACLNVCPVYRQVGGHAYQTVYAGRDPAAAADTDARGTDAGVRLVALWIVRRRLPGPDRHPAAAGPRPLGCCPHRQAGIGGARAPRSRTCLLEQGAVRESTAARTSRAAAAGRRGPVPAIPWSPGGLGRVADAARVPEGDLPRVVGP